MFDKVKFVAKNVIYVKKWSENTLQTNILVSNPSAKTNNGRHLNIKQGSFLIKIIKDSDKLMQKVKKLRQKSFLQNLQIKNLTLMSLTNIVII